MRIYHEHPACSGGRETFLHWLPRGLELFLLDQDRDFSMLEAMIRLAPSRWSFEEQDAVRVVLGRAAIGWFGGSSPAPLHCSTDGKDPSGDGGVSEALVRALLAFRIDPFDLFAWLARTGGRRAYEALLDLAFTPRLTEDPVYFVLEDKADESTQHIALAALDRLARDVLSRIVAGHDRAMRLWTWAEHADPALAHDIAALETTWRGRLSRLSSAARATDRALITAAIGQRA